VEVCQDCETPEDESSENPLAIDPDYESEADLGGADPGRRPYGTNLGEYRGVRAYSNYKECADSPDCWYGVGNGRSVGEYGYHFQCVEYIIRFYVDAFGYENMRGSGDAKRYWDNPGTSAASNLERLPNGGTVPPQPGDIIVFSGGTYGHVAIVREACREGIRIIQQNWYHNEGDANHWLGMRSEGGRYTVDNLSASFSVLGWLRVPGSTLECTCDDLCDAGQFCDNGICVGDPPCDPDLTRLQPATGCPGDSFQLTAFGSCLKEDPMQGVRIHIADVELTNRVLVSEHEVRVSARVLPGAEPGPREVAYANSDQRRGSWDGLFTVLPVGSCGGGPECSDEVCDGEDNDCDGQVDENLARDCRSACADGTEECVNGQWRNCDAPQPGREEDSPCDERDNDCDGQTDEGQRCDCDNGETRQCGQTDVGECQYGRETCRNHTWSGDCVGDVDSVPETCDGRDNDCDGRADENLSRDCQSACGQGTETCSNGRWRNCDAPQPQVEVCNNRDDDCDGRTDEGLICICEDGDTRQCGQTDVGECRFGQETCRNNDWPRDGCVGEVDPLPETCDGRDNDCDGQRDENLSRGCQSACGQGTETCSNGQWRNCNAPQPAAEVCDGRDNDCDGRVDEGALCNGGRACLGGQCVGISVSPALDQWTPPGPCDPAQGHAIYQGKPVSVDASTNRASISFAKCMGGQPSQDLTFWVVVGVRRPTDNTLCTHASCTRTSGDWPEEWQGIRVNGIDIWPSVDALADDPCGTTKDIYVITDGRGVEGRRIWHQYESVRFTKTCQ